jgi:hypothetical protein
MDFKERQRQFSRPIESEDLEKVSQALKGAIETKAMTAKEVASVQKTVDLVKNGTNNDVINHLMTLILLLKVPELKAIQFAIGKFAEREEMREGAGVLKKILEKSGIDLEKFKNISEKDISEIEEVLKGVEA